VLSLRDDRPGAPETLRRPWGPPEVADEQPPPFVLRLYLTAGSTRIRVVPSLVFDADPDTLFLTSLGLRFDVPLRAEPHDRHVRVAGSEGFLTEAVRPVTGLRRDPGQPVRQAQTAGRTTPATKTWSQT